MQGLFTAYSPPRPPARRSNEQVYGDVDPLLLRQLLLRRRLVGGRIVELGQLILSHLGAGILGEVEDGSKG